MNLAQLNIARLRFPLDGPELKDFVDALPEINGLGDASPGFVWRLQDDSGDATGVANPFGEGVIINLTVWESVEALREFIYRSPHLDYMRRRREWFDHNGIEAHLVLWWVPEGHTPTVDEAAERLAHLEKHGSTEHAFTLREPYPAA
ncbi:hypothetical protein Rhe02_40290 [Rhizocola hellebori]|uniref:DUF3291 domain-containing protein n=1 Tax=Rhizocola hellebori TaxID=1392758 RepID=A0A8J3QA25_9ACTN|nr:DUF3291 domain-containing protein [Rhizocola hellebori]GIH05962.1 hypothetical protein Rhe02_40290 [Rhizocola hellebori]